jgi:hypothetical protein
VANAFYEHAYALVQAHGEAGWTARLVPLAVDGPIYAGSMVTLDSALDWLVSSVINGIKRLPCDFGWP